MIFYFSGTGNSKWIAEELARRTGDEALNIAEVLRDGATAVYAGCGARIGLVFPVYAWGAPLIVERFCKQMKLSECAYAYAVCTCGDEAGLAMRRLKKKFSYHSAWSIAMPNNYIIGYDLDSEAHEQEKMRSAAVRLEAISQAILTEERVYDVHEGVGAGVKTALIRPLFNTFARATKHFYAKDVCNGCGLCARICPIGAISMQENRPVWVKKHCTQCLGCINRCPMRAIEYGKSTTKRGRYSCQDALERQR